MHGTGQESTAQHSTTQRSTAQRSLTLHCYTETLDTMYGIKAENDDFEMLNKIIWRSNKKESAEISVLLLKIVVLVLLYMSTLTSMRMYRLTGKMQ